MKARIIEFITNLSDGGAEHLVKDYATMIDERKFDVYVLTIRNFTNTAVYKELKKNGIKIISVYPTWNIIIKIFNKVFGKLYIDYRLKSIIKEISPDAIHAHLYILKYLNRIARDIKGIRLFYTCHSVPSRYFGRQYPEQTKAAKALIKNNNLRLIALHDEMREELNEMFCVDNTVVIRNGINLKKYNNIQESKNDIRGSLGIPSNAYVVGHIGRFIDLKNHDFLIKIFNEILKKKDNSYLLLVGDGELRSNIEKQIHEMNLDRHVKILSHRDDVPRLLKAMDVFVFPSKVEGFGIVAIEAQAVGLRCVMSDAVPESTHVTKYAIPLSLKESAEKWADVILDDKIVSDYPDTLFEYDMNLEIKKLEKLYLDE